MFQQAILREADVEPLAEGVLAVLEQVGILCQNEEILTALDAAGARVDYASQRVKFPKQMVAEFVENLRRENPPPDPAPSQFVAPGLPTIEEVGIGLKANYLQAAHTVHNFRSCLWLPEFIDRSGWNGFASEAEVLDKVQKKVNALIAEYVKPEGREEKLAKMRGVVEKARAELLA